MYVLKMFPKRILIYAISLQILSPKALPALNATLISRANERRAVQSRINKALPQSWFIDYPVALPWERTHTLSPSRGAVVAKASTPDLHLPESEETRGWRFGPSSRSCFFISSGVTKPALVTKLQPQGAWLAQSEELATLDLGSWVRAPCPLYRLLK